MSSVVSPYAAPPPPTIAVDAALDVGGAAITLDVPAGATRVWLWRESPSGEQAYVRGVVDLSVTPSTQLLLFDFEAPLGVALTYYASSANDAGETSATPSSDTITLTQSQADDPWIIDVGQPGNIQQVVVESLAQLDYTVPVGVHKVIGRRAPIVLSDVAPYPTCELVFVTSSDDEREMARATLGNGIPFLLKTVPEHGVGQMYLSVLSWSEQRPSRLAQHEDRRFRAQCQQVDRPDPKLIVPTTMIATYLDVRDGFDDYADVKASRSSYQALMLTFGGGAGGTVEPWPPDDS